MQEHAHSSHQSLRGGASLIGATAARPEENDRDQVTTVNVHRRYAGRGMTDHEQKSKRQGLWWLASLACLASRRLPRSNQSIN